MSSNGLPVSQLALSLFSQMESPVSTPAVLPLHLLVPVVNNDISSPCEQIMVRTRSVGVNTCDVALATEPECLGPCEPGTSVNLEGIVWQETEDGKSIPSQLLLQKEPVEAYCWKYCQAKIETLPSTYKRSQCLHPLGSTHTKGSSILFSTLYHS